MKESEQPTCLVCQSQTLANIAPDFKLPGVTSDDKPWPSSTCVYFCENCAHVQKIPDKKWLKHRDAVYADYELYKLTEGKEHLAQGNDALLSRSEAVFNKLKNEIVIPESGRLLDFGCGNGAVLRFFGQRYKSWSLTGFDSDKSYGHEILSLAGVEAFYSQGLDQIAPGFDLITAFYVMEHVTQPVDLLLQLRHLLSDSGLLAIVVPNFLENPFDLMIVDHCSHFTPNILALLGNQCGFEIVKVATHWVPRAVVTVFSKNSTELKHEAQPVLPMRQRAVYNIKWLEDIVFLAQEEAKADNFGLFGTATAGSWLAGLLNERVSFFVDEDPRRIGKNHLGLPILRPRDVPEAATVFLGLPHSLALKIRSKLASAFPRIKFILPPIHQ